MFAARTTIALLFAACIPAAAWGAPSSAVRTAAHHAAAHAAHHAAGHAPHHAAPKHHSAPKKSPHHSTPHHHPKAKTTPHKTAPSVVKIHPATHHHPSRSHRHLQSHTATTLKVTDINKYSYMFYPTRSYSHYHNGGYHGGYGSGGWGGYGRYYTNRYSYSRGSRSWWSSRYSHRHHSNSRHVVRGVVNTTLGTAATGAVEVKVLPARTNRFHYGMTLNVPRNARLKTYQVNNLTSYARVMNANGLLKPSTFKDLAPGEPVLIVTPRTGNNLAQTIEIFPVK
jgi:hypothetical protein